MEFELRKGQRAHATAYCSDACRRDGKSIHSRAGSYGLIPTQLKDLLRSHSGRCDICGEVESWQGRTQARINKLSIDHDHATGAIRGFLCAHCNHAIGKFQDDPQLLRRAAEYLERSRLLGIA